LAAGSTAIGIEPDTVDREVFHHRLQTGGHFLDAGDSRRVDIVQSWAESGIEGFVLEDIEQFQIRLGVLD